MALLWTYQPFKGLLTAFTVASTPVYLMILVIYYLPKQLRPSTEWSLQNAVSRHLLRILFSHFGTVRPTPSYSLKPGALKDRFVLVKPGPTDLYRGLLNHPTIKPVPVSAAWFPKCATPDDKVVLHFQGGAFVTTTKVAETGEYPSSLFASKMDGAVTFYTQYRVASSNETRFPAALQDAVTFYYYLLDLGIPSKNIILSGDSAGGNLVLALQRYIEQNKDILSSPLGIMAWSPWVDISSSAVQKLEKSTYHRTDYLPLNILYWGVDAYKPDPYQEDAEPFLSPINHPFAISAPLYIHVGGGEIFCSEMRKFAETMEKVPNNKVKCFETPNAPHDLLQMAKILGFQKEIEEAVQVAHEFIGN